jgi:peroxiredoxin Q/BCP
MTRLAAGDKAPAFTLLDHNGKSVRLSDFKGSKVVVYFYPKDDTPGCTKEACQFSENLEAFDKAGVTVLGISVDSMEKHQAFRAKYGLTLSLLSDPERSTMEAYGAFGEKMMYGKKVTGVIRSTFIIDEKGKIERTWYSVKADGHAAKVLEVFSA